MASGPPKKLTPFGYALAGALGGCFANAVVYPLDTIKTRIQAAEPESDDEDGNKEDLTVFGLIMSVLREEGIGGLYHGFAATMLNTFSMQYAYFFFYSIVRGRYTARLAARSKRALSTPEELFLGAVAGALAQIFTIPVSVIATRQQVGQHLRKHHAAVAAAAAASKPAALTNGAANGHANGVANGTANGYPTKPAPPPDDSFLGVAREIVREEGIGGLWLGIKPGLVLTVNPAITYGVFERVKGALVLARGAGASTKLGPWTSFALGATSKTLATIVTYPYIMAKIRIQARTADADSEHDQHRPHNPHRHPGALEILLRVWRHEGLPGLYQGMAAQIVKAVLAQGVLFMSKEKFEHWALALMVLWYRISHPHLGR